MAGSVAMISTSSQRSPRSTILRRTSRSSSVIEAARNISTSGLVRSAGKAAGAYRYECHSGPVWRFQRIPSGVSIPTTGSVSRTEAPRVCRPASSRPVSPLVVNLGVRSSLSAPSSDGNWFPSVSNASNASWKISALSACRRS